jgi:hypothetical protein
LSGARLAWSHLWPVLLIGFAATVIVLTSRLVACFADPYFYFWWE